MAEWSRVVNTTISDFVKGEEVNILRNRKMLALMKARGRITFNHGGTSIVKRVRYKRAPMIGYADGDSLTFSRRDRWKTAEQEWRGYSVTDAMSKKERLMNKNAQQIIDLYADVGKALVDDINDGFGEEFYVDGNATGNTKKIHGIESFFGAGSPATNGYIVSPSDTYMNLKTDLGNYGGSWATSGGNVTWPTGTGDSHYDFWSPLLVSYTNASFAASSDTWANNCVEALRFALIKGKKNKTKTGATDYVTLEDEMYRLYLGAIDSKQQIHVMPNSGQEASLISLGFKDVTYFDGAEVTYEYGMPSGVGYGLNVDQMELMSLQAQLFVVEGPEYDLQTKSWKTSVDFFGNMVVNPRYQFKLLAGG